MTDKPHILATKLYVPSLRANLVDRPHLISRLNEGVKNALTVICAPAGFGKTTLLSEWVTGLSKRGNSTDSPLVCWLTLDEADNDLCRFNRYLIAALQTVAPEVGVAALSSLAMSMNRDSVPMESALTSLINDLMAVRKTCILILDDYHFITAQPVHQALIFLLEHLPPNVHLIISSRADPPLIMSRLRARNQLTELRVADLRFSIAETADFLNNAMGLMVSEDDIAALDVRTEGWITGLQLVALALKSPLSSQANQDASVFIAAFTGSNRYVLDYLVEEVLSRQPDHVQDFMLLTSILDHMIGPLCDAITGRTDGQLILEQLENANLFIIPLDHDRKWYRYHHLFTEFLRSRLQLHFSEANNISGEVKDVVELHSRASLWYEDQGLLDEAIEHALYGGEYDRAADLIKKHVRSPLMPDRVGTFLYWMKLIPEPFLLNCPDLLLRNAWALLMGGQLEAVESCLHTIGLLDIKDDDPLHAEAVAIQCLLAVIKGDSQNSRDLALKALKHIPPESSELRGWLYMNLGLAYDELEDMEAASQAYLEAIKISKAANNLAMSLTPMAQLADIWALQGKLRQAVDLYRDALQLTLVSGQRLPMAAIMLMRLGRILYEWNQLEEAEQVLSEAVELGGKWESGDMLITSLVYLAYLRQVQGDERSARELGQQALRAEEKGMTSRYTVRIAEAWLVHVWLCQGELAAVERWIEACKKDSPPERRHYHSEAEDTAIARYYLATGNPGAIPPLLSPLLQAAEVAGRNAVVIEILIILALAYKNSGEDSDALKNLARALELSEAGGYIRSYVDEGHIMAEMLRRLQAEGQSSPYITRLLEASETTLSTSAKRKSSIPVSRSGENVDLYLAEPLSEREIQVLSLIAEGHSNQDIAQKLYIAPSTVKTHINNIYAKLGVETRVQAVIRARALNLLSN